MFAFIVSYAIQASLLFAANSNWPLAVAALSLVLGRPDNGSLTVVYDSVVPSWLNWFIEVKVYGALAAFVAQIARWVVNKIGVRQIGVLGMVVFITSGVLFSILALLDCIFVWLLLLVPLSLLLALLLVFGPLLILVNIVFVYRVGLTMFFYFVGIRDPFTDPGYLGRLVVRVFEALGPRSAAALVGFNDIIGTLLVVPFDLFTTMSGFFFLPTSLRFSSRASLATSRLLWGVSFFFFGFFDVEAMIWLAVAVGVGLFSWGCIFVSQVAGLDTLLDVLVPTVLVVSTEAVANAVLLVPVGVLWVVGQVIERAGVTFTPLVDGKPLEIRDAETFMAAPPHVRRDIVLSFMSFGGASRFLLGLGVVLSLYVIWIVMSGLRVFRDRVYAVPLLILKCLMFFMIPVLLPDSAILIMDLSFSHLESLSAPLTVWFFETGFAFIRFLFPLLGWVAIHATRVPRLQHPHETPQPRLSTVFFSGLLSLTRRSVLRLVERMNEVRLPEFVSNVYEPPSIESITRAYQLLADVGFPVTQNLLSELTEGADVGSTSYLQEHGSWKKWFMGSISIKLGYPKIKVRPHSWVPASWLEVFPGYLHVAGWNSEKAEVDSTARYWTGNNAQKIPGDNGQLKDDLWEAVKAQYMNSRLATFQEIYAGWTKRFNMGFGFVKEVNGKVKQLTRAEVIQMMGGKWKFLEAWERVFNRGLGMHLPAPVFAKYESLKQKKALEGVVRTIVGSQFIHHVLTTVFNYHPNHNYKVWETPMKVGMPINGQNYNRLWVSLMRHDKVWAGDMTAFDSRVSPAIVRVVAAIRKEGYDLHKDRTKICELIDVCYEMLLRQPMGFKNTGDIAGKDQGFTTGHSSTSPDNSLALVANYLFAWRYVTGLRAREFFNYNTLANFGDDHVLGYDPVFGWCPDRIIEAMKQLGTIMRDEAPGEERLPEVGVDFNTLKFAFLAKVPVPLDGKVKAELHAAGVTVPLTYATAHDRDRLMGKALGEVLANKAQDSVRSYTALISYLYMTAHHHDLYLKLVVQARVFRQNHMEAWKKAGIMKPDGTSKKLPPPPSYNAVLRQWYAKEPFPYTVDEDEGEDVEGKYISLHLQDDLMMVIVRWLADVPTMLSPRYTNTRWADWLQVKLAWALNWPLSFVALANQVEGDLRASKVYLAKTPYAFLRNDALVPDLTVPFGVLHTRHLFTLGMTRLLGVKRSFSVLDLLRLFDTSWANLVFFFTGQVTTVAIELDLHIVDTLIILLASFIHIDSGVSPCPYDLLSPSILFARFFSAGLRLITPAGAIDYQPLDAQVRRLMMDPAASFTLEAPTGTGKSTRMMMRISSMLPGSMKMVVIEPRRMVAIGVGTYMKHLYPEGSIGILTEGYTLTGSEKLIYTTGQSFLLSNALRTNKGVVIVLDEAHIMEPIYVVMRNLMTLNVGRRRIFVTATPSSDILSLGLPHLAVPAVNQNVIVKVVHEVSSQKEYLAWCKLFVEDRLPLEKTLIFVPSVWASYQLAGSLPRRVCVLNSKSIEIDPTAAVFIATSVADAGLTIPDVSFVLTMDFDVAVTRPDVDLRRPSAMPFRAAFEGSDTRSYYFRLSEATLKQRMGRTGRTLDGTFHLFKVTSVKVDPLEFSLTDFADGCAPASAVASGFFPRALTRQQPYFKPFGQLWSDLDSRGWNLFLGWRDRFLTLTDGQGTPQQFGKYLQDNLGQVKRSALAFIIPEVDPEQAPFGEDEPPSTGEPSVIPDPEPAAAVVWAPPAPVMTRQDVSGEGLLCGVRALMGAIWSVTSLRPTFADVHAACLDQVSPDVILEESDRNFYALTLRDAAWISFGVALTIEFDDGTQSIPPNPSITYPPDTPHALIFQSVNHYNYLGYPLLPSLFL